jgi:D-sedoheptulose 7-phosphate isomerase
LKSNSHPIDQLDLAISELELLVADLRDQKQIINQMTQAVLTALENGNKLIFMGNGGAAAESQHIAAEFVGKVRRDRKALAAIAITTDSSILTAVANDWDFNEVYSRQIEALCSPDDVVIAISGSGASYNLIKAMDTANNIGAVTIVCTGSAPNPLAELSNVSLAMPTTSTSRVQEVSLLVWHSICESIDDTLIEE